MWPGVTHRRSPLNHSDQTRDIVVPQQQPNDTPQTNANPKTTQTSKHNTRAKRAQAPTTSRCGRAHANVLRQARGAKAPLAPHTGHAPLGPDRLCERTRCARSSTCPASGFQIPERGSPTSRRPSMKPVPVAASAATRSASRSLRMASMKTWHEGMRTVVHEQVCTSLRSPHAGPDRAGHPTDPGGMRVPRRPCSSSGRAGRRRRT